MQAELIKKYGRPVPRYTSYPTAPHFSEMSTTPPIVTGCRNLATITACRFMSTFRFATVSAGSVACHTKHTRKYQPVADYLDVLKKEIAEIGSQVGGRPEFNRLHWGGGSPTILEEADILALADCIKSNFAASDEFEFSVEIDPRELSNGQMDALARAGMTRASIGVQDFNSHVQQHINRIQTFEETLLVVRGLRERGVQSLNLDVMYGLPGQDMRDLRSTWKRPSNLLPTGSHCSAMPCSLDEKAPEHDPRRPVTGTTGAF